MTSPHPDIGSGNSCGMAANLQPSPQGGIWAGGWWSNNNSYECFYTDIVGGLEIGKDYEIKFYQVFAGLKHGGNSTVVGALGRWRVEVSNGIPGGSPAPIAEHKLFFLLKFNLMVLELRYGQKLLYNLLLIM